jgi:hypothetical protein
VTNLDTGTTKPSLQAAVNAAAAGDRLKVKGICRGTTTIGQDLRISGLQTATSGQPILGGYNGRTSWAKWVVKVKSRATVTIRDLTIQGGVDASGISNAGSLTLRDVVVRDNGFMAGGGVDNRGTLVLNGASVIRANSANWGAGVMNDGGILVLNDSSSITRNGALSDGGGVAVWGGGTLVMNDASSITRNTAQNGDQGNTAGGAFIGSDSTLVGVVCAPEASANVYGNTAPDCYFQE